MYNNDFLHLLDGRQRQRVEEIARDMGVSPLAACVTLIEIELEKNPDLIAPNSPELSNNGARNSSVKRSWH